MNKWRKILIIVAGIVLMILGFAAAILYMWQRMQPLGDMSASVQMPGGIWRILLLLSSPIWIFSGIRLFSLKRSSQKLALLSYGIALFHAVYFNILAYLLALYLSYSGEKPNPYSIANIQAYFRMDVWVMPISIFFIIVFFIGILFLFKEQFK